MNMNIDKLIEDDIKNKTNKTLREKSLRTYYKNPNYCLYCNNMIIVGENEVVAKTRKKKFCNKQCLFNYRNENMNTEHHRVCQICGNKIAHSNQSNLCVSCFKKTQANEKIRIWKETGNTGCGTSSTLRNCIRDYIFEKQNKQCSICHMDAQWNGKDLHFILDHIDGDAANNFEDNLRLICPNCDSQLDTYKSRNKNSARSHRRTE